VDSKGRANIGNDTGIKLYQLLVDLVKKYNVMPSTPISIEEGRTAFKAGVAAMYVDGTQVFGSVRAAQPHTGTFPLPSLMAAEPAAEFPTGQAFTIGINSKNKDAAWRFIKFMLKPEAQLINAKVADQLPAIKSALQDPWFHTNQGAQLLQWGDNLAKNSRGLKIPEHYIFLMDCMAKAYEQVLVGGKPIPEALEEAAKRFNKRAGLE
jgi:multiple sugar transport system substrate-binding protein